MAMNRIATAPRHGHPVRYRERLGKGDPFAASCCGKEEGLTGTAGFFA